MLVRCAEASLTTVRLTTIARQQEATAAAAAATKVGIPMIVSCC